MAMLPPLSAIGNVIIQMFGDPEEVSARWDEVYWDQGAKWHGQTWQDITPESLNVQITWGTDDNMGALSLTSAGSWSVQTYDPERLLDPANYNSHFYNVLKPGNLVRVMYREGVTDYFVRQGYLDEVRYDVFSKTGSLRATDGISLLVKAKIPAGLAHQPSTPITLRAFARFILLKAGVGYIQVEDDIGSDPPVGFAIDEEASAWAHIVTASLDALYGVWLDRSGVLRFRYFGNPVKRDDVHLGSYPNGIPLESIETRLSLDGVFNHVRAKYFRDQYGTTDPIYHEVVNQSSIDVVGDLLISRERPIPNSSEWVRQISQDRGAAAVQYELGTIRPRTPTELKALLSVELLDAVGIHATRYGTPINRDVTVLGGSIEANTVSGWSAHLTTYEPASPWWGNEEATRIYQRRYTCDKSVEYIDINGVKSTQYDLADLEVMGSPVADVEITPQRHLIAMDFPQLDFAGMTTIWDAQLWVYLPFHDDIEPEGSPRVNELEYLRLCRINAAWSEGGSTTPPAYSTTNEVYTTKGDFGKWMAFDLRGIVGDWKGGAAVQEGLLMFPHPGYPKAIFHAIVSGRKSVNPPYLLISFQKG